MSFRPQLAYFLGGALSFGLALVAAKQFRKPPRELREGAALGDGAFQAPSPVSPLVDSSAWGTAEVVDVDVMDGEPPPELVIDSSVADAGFVDARFSSRADTKTSAGSANDTAEPKASAEGVSRQTHVALEALGGAWLPDATQPSSTETSPAPGSSEVGKVADDPMDDITDLSGRPTDPMLGEIFATRFEPDEPPRRYRS